jgi:predicted DNA-binding transcriptional regulator AlpA
MGIYPRNERNNTKNTYTTPDGELVLTLAGVASFLCVSRHTLDRMIDRNDAPPLFRIGKRFFCLASNLRDWRAARQSNASEISAARFAA